MADTDVSPLIQRLLTPPEHVQLDESQFKSAFPAARDALTCLAGMPRGERSNRREEWQNK